MQQAIRTAFLSAIAMPLVRFLASPAVKSEVTEWPASPMLIVANHITSYDAALILFALPHHVRNRVAIAMSGEMLLDLPARPKPGELVSERARSVCLFPDHRTV